MKIKEKSCIYFDKTAVRWWNVLGRFFCWFFFGFFFLGKIGQMELMLSQWITIAEQVWKANVHTHTLRVHAQAHMLAHSTHTKIRTWTLAYVCDLRKCYSKYVKICGKESWDLVSPLSRFQLCNFFCVCACIETKAFVACILTSFDMNLPLYLEVS